MSQEILLKLRVNPLLVLSSVLGSVRGAGEVLDRPWELFVRYFTYKLLKGDEGKARSAVLEAEEFAQIFNRVADKLPADVVLETGASLYFILRSEGILKRYEATLVEPILGAISKCIDDYNRGVASIESSPALSRCLGLSYAFIDELSEDYRSVLEGLAELCAEPAPQHIYFCLNMAFARALLAIVRRERDATFCNCIAKLGKLVTKSGVLDDVVFAFLVVGLSRYIGCNTEKASLDMFQALAKAFETHGRALLRKSRRTWRMLSLALRLNRLERIAYVPEGYRPVKEDVIKKLAELLSRESMKREALVIYISSALTAVSLVVGAISLVIPSLPYLLQYYMPIATSFIVLIPVMLMLYRHLKLRKVAMEPEIQRLLEEIKKE